MTAPYNTWSAIGVEYAYWGLRGSNGYVYGTTGATLANGASSGMGRMKGVVDFTPAVPAPNVIDVVGDLRNVATFRTAPTASITADLNVAVFDTTFVTKVNDTLAETLGDYKFVDIDPYCVNNQPLVFVLNAPASVQDSGVSLGASAYDVTIIYNSLVDAPTLTALTAGEQTWAYNLTLNKTGVTPYGATLTEVTNGLTQSYFRKFASPNPVTMHSFIGDGTEADVVLDLTPASASANAVRVWVDGVAQTYTTDFTVNVGTKTVTFEAGSVPSAGEKVVVLYQHTVTC